VRSALTDAELFISYNMPAKALGPLVAALPMAPNDLRINQRLAALHTRAGRFAEAAVCCRTLQNLYSEAEYPEEATRYGELAERYEERASAPTPGGQVEETHIFLDAPQVSAPPPGAAEIPVSEPAEEAEEASEAEPEAAAEAEVPAPWPAAEQAEEITAEPAAETEFAVTEDSAAAPARADSEIDLSSEWDDSVTIEAEAPEGEGAPVEAAAESTKTEETIEEIRFYLANGMPEQAMAALAKLQTLTGDQGILAELRTEVEAAALHASEEVEVQVETEPGVEELTASDIPSIEAAAEETAVAEEPVAAEPTPPAEEAPVAAEVATAEPEPEPVASEAEPTRGVLTEFVSELESSLGEDYRPRKVAKPVEPPAPVVTRKRVPIHAAPIMGQFVADIEAPVGGDFLKAAPVAERPAPPAPKAAPAPAPARAVAPKASPAIAASAAASASAPSYVAPAAQPSAPAPWPTPAIEAPKPQPPAVPAVRTPAAPASAGVSPFGEEAGVDLAEMFGELKQDLEADVVASDDDPETHYNLGIAFREMGLLDEAIGELQKACQAFDRGHPFPQIMQTYTWLAQCFLEKGVPEAAVRWYEKALGVPTIDGETRVALNYELASAYETAGDRRAALKHFMDVYGANIDYRDVAERIKALKS
jgi:hypothetical protein